MIKVFAIRRHEGQLNYENQLWYYETMLRILRMLTCKRKKKEKRKCYNLGRVNGLTSRLEIGPFHLECLSIFKITFHNFADGIWQSYTKESEVNFGMTVNLA